jgi:hypothetical protein
VDEKRIGVVCMFHPPYYHYHLSILNIIILDDALDRNVARQEK